jgi:cardiolipin synthase
LNSDLFLPATPLQGERPIQLLQGSAEFFPALVAAVDRARTEVRLETYIFDFTSSAADVAHALMRAARRGVTVQLVVDGVGTGAFPPEWRVRFEQAGVQWRVYSSLGPLGLLLPRRWRRLHRKLCVVDGAVAFCGGINILDDLHDPHHGALALPRLDFAVRVSGVLAQQVQDVMAQLWRHLQAVRDGRPRPFPAAPGAPHAPTGSRRDARRAARAGAGAVHAAWAALLLRDNLRHRSRIEKAYRRAIGEAHREVIIANAYFLPGRKLRRALMMAARRGVRVQLLLQGKYEYFMQYHAARPVYGALLGSGVEIYEYAASFLHAKVAVVDGRWMTVGSSNLDPLSLLLAREANVVVNDAGLAGELRGRLVRAMTEGGRRVDAAHYAARPWRQRLRDRVAFGLMRAALFLTGYRY